MYAIVEIAGRQYRVEENKHLVVNRLQAEAGSTIEFNKVLLVGGEKIKVGAPTVAGASVTATDTGIIAQIHRVRYTIF